MVLRRQPPLKKPYFYSFFCFRKRCQKKPKLFLPLCPKKMFLERCWITSQRSLIGPKTENRKTLIDTKICHKNPQKPYFCSAKMVPQEVVLFLTLEVVLFLTLERPKSGTKTNSPAYIYIYIYACFLPVLSLFLSLSLALFLSFSQPLCLPLHINLATSPNPPIPLSVPPLSISL